MPIRDYLFTFAANPATRASLAPSFISFVNSSGQTLTPPAITETYAGTGFYKVTYNATQTIFFTLDGATTGLATSERYIAGMFTSADQFDSTLIAIGATVAMLSNVNGLGSTLSFINSNVLSGGVTIAGIAQAIGTTSDSFGSDLSDPLTLFGFLKRAQEVAEGNQTYVKATGILDIYSRGSSTLLREKTVSDSSTTTTKT